MPTTRYNLVLLGRTIGTYSDWDGDICDTIVYYDFIRSSIKPSLDEPKQDLQVNVIQGIVEVNDVADPDNPITIARYDIIQFAEAFPRDRPVASIPPTA